MIKNLMVVLLLVLTDCGLLQADTEKVPPTALLRKIFPNAQLFVPKDLKLTGDLRKHIEKALGSPLEDHDVNTEAYVAMVADRSVGTAWMTDVHLGGKAADVLVGVDPKGNVVGVALQHCPAAALALAQPAHLAQFRGKTPNSPFQVGIDLKAAPGKASNSKELAKCSAAEVPSTFPGSGQRGRHGRGGVGVSGLAALILDKLVA